MRAHKSDGQNVFRLRAGAADCDVDGLRIADLDLLDRDAASRSGHALPPIDAIEERLWRAYGCRVSAEAKLGGLRVVAEALNQGDLARAQIAALLLKLPEPPAKAPQQALAKRLHECGWLLKDWDQEEHPRTGTPPNPGWFAPKDGDAEGRRKPHGVQVASNETGTRTDARTAQADIPIDPQLFPQDLSPEETRKKIAEIAKSLVGDQRWIDNGRYGIYRPGSHKCFLFVAFVLGQADADPGTPNMYYLTPRPPFAGQWADPSFTIPGWRVLGPDETPTPGDVVAQKIGYSDASGHVMIVGDGNTFIGAGIHGNGPAGNIEQIPAQSALTDNPDVSKGPLVFRRWIGR